MRHLWRTCSRHLVRDVRLAAQRRPSAFQRRNSTASSRQWSTPLAKGLAEAITTTGPVSVAAYMRQCLTASDGGYYTSLLSHDRDQFGTKGDFVTSPEISQVFGELVGIWTVAEWMAQGKNRNGVQLMELGPGRGTLMDDVLRTICNFEDLVSSIEAIHLIETSPQLRAKQHALLCGAAPLEETEDGHRSISKHLKGVPILWTEDLRLIPQDPLKSPFIIAHEFFDALPIHIFQSVPIIQQSAIPKSVADRSGTLPNSSTVAEPAPSPHNEWRELVVSPVSPHNYTPSTNEKTEDSSTDFELSLSKQSTPHSMLLPQSSPRYTALSQTAGSTIEISPESLSIIASIATRIGGGNPLPSSSSSKQAPRALARPAPKPQPSGAALILDYGPATTIPANTLRGIRSHKRVSPFSSPGLVDLSADVDFRGLAEAAIDASPGVVVHGPAEQGVWLRAMGIEERAGVLEQSASVDERRTAINGSWKRLVDRGPNGMGKLYKAMALLPYKKDQVFRRPVGFGGDIGTRE